MAEEFNCEFSERTFVKASEVVVLAKNTEDDGEVVGVLSRILGEDENIVEEDDDKVVEVGAEDVIHGALKGSRGVGEAKGHDFELVVAVTSPKCCFGDIILSHADLPVARFEIDFGEDRGALEAVEEFLSAGDGIPILDRLFVEGAEVDTEAESTPFLADK